VPADGPDVIGCAVMSEAVSLPGSLRGYLSVPDGMGPWPGVVVLHEAFGLNDDIRAMVDRLAGDGFVTLAPDLFSWGPTARCLVSTFRDLIRREGPAHRRIDGIGEWLAHDERCTGRVGVVGFCMGGGFALLAATRRRFGASSVNYGLVPHHAEKLLAGACPIVASYGGRDRTLSGHAARLDAALAANAVDHDVKEYPGAGHSFMNRHAGWATAFDRVGFGYAPAEAEDSWARILEFFRRHLAE
jgi:carboxymethylenebutenolidase